MHMFSPNANYVEIRYNSLKILLSDVILRLQGLMFGVPAVSLVRSVLHCESKQTNDIFCL